MRNFPNRISEVCVGDDSGEDGAMELDSGRKQLRARVEIMGKSTVRSTFMFVGNNVRCRFESFLIVRCSCHLTWNQGSSIRLVAITAVVRSVVGRGRWEQLALRTVPGSYRYYCTGGTAAARRHRPLDTLEDDDCILFQPRKIEKASQRRHIRKPIRKHVLVHK